MHKVPSRTSIYETVTAQIVAAIEAGAGDCVMPWHAGIVPMTLPTNAATQKPYRGINVVALWARASLQRYITGYWASYRQWQALGAQVRTGERGTAIVFYKKLESGDASGPDGETDAPAFVLRYSHAIRASSRVSR